jgi:hypothetical protein
MERVGMILDVTHLSDQCFDEALDVYGGPVLASHHNCRALVPNQRQLTDEQIKRLVARGAVIGTALDAWMLHPGWVRGETRPEEAGVTLATVVDHIDRVCQLAGDDRHAAIGTDLDGGFGREQSLPAGGRRPARGHRHRPRRRLRPRAVAGRPRHHRRPAAAARAAGRPGLQGRGRRQHHAPQLAALLPRRLDSRGEVTRPGGVVSQPYDASTKHLVDAYLPDWLPLGGRPTQARSEIISADLSTVTAAADKVLRVHDDPAWLLHLELHAYREEGLGRRLNMDNGLLEHRHGLLVRTVVVLLRRSADHPELTGTLERGFPGEPPYRVFRYHPVRVWQLPVDAFLQAGLGVVPLAPLADVPQADLPGVVGRMGERFRGEAAPEEAARLWTAAGVLMGLRYPEDLIQELLRGVRAMRDSTFYQAILNEGRNEGRSEGLVEDRQNVLLELGEVQFGPPSPEIQAAVRSITDFARLQQLTRRLLAVSSWQELLASA